jgi:hypothetical protein
MAKSADRLDAISSRQTVSVLLLRVIKEVSGCKIDTLSGREAAFVGLVGCTTMTGRTAGGTWTMRPFGVSEVAYGD